MYTNQIIRLSDKQLTSSTLTAMKVWVEAVMKYPLVWIPLKEGDKKTSDAIDRICTPLYKNHTIFRSIVHDFMGSVVLIENSNAVPHMIKEVAQFCGALDIFYKKIVAGNARQEVAQYYKQFTLKPAQIETLFITDLKQYGEQYGFEVDIKDVMSQYKEIRKAYLNENS